MDVSYRVNRSGVPGPRGTSLNRSEVLTWDAPGPPRQRPPGQRPLHRNPLYRNPQTETPCTETPLERPPDRDPWTETPRQRPPIQRPFGQRLPWIETPGQRPLRRNIEAGTETPLEGIWDQAAQEAKSYMGPPVDRMTDTCKTIT